MTSRAYLLLILAYSLLFAGVVFLNNSLIALALPLVVYFLGALFFSPQKVDVSVVRTLSGERVAPNMPVVMKFEIKNNATACDEIYFADPALPNAEIADGSPRRLLNLKRNRSTDWSYTFIPKRGYYPLGRVDVVARETFGLIENRAQIKTEGQLLVLPPESKLKRVAIHPRQTKVYSGSIRARSGGPGVEFFGVREYNAGDSMHWVNWRATAHSDQKIFTNEFEQERVADIGIILDARTRVNEFSEGRSIFEYSVLAAASLADAFLSGGNRVGLLTYGMNTHWTFPGYGKLQRERILQSLSRAQIGETLAFSELIIPRKLFPAQSQIILISPLLSEDAETLVRLRARGYQVMLVSPNPISFELNYLAHTKNIELASRVVRLQRRMLLHRIQRAGVQVINWDVNQPFEQTMQIATARSLAVR